MLFGFQGAAETSKKCAGKKASTYRLRKRRLSGRFPSLFTKCSQKQSDIVHSVQYFSFFGQKRNAPENRCVNGTNLVFVEAYSSYKGSTPSICV